MIKKIRDEHQREYEYDSDVELGKGGQGRVFRVRNSPLAVKILNKTSERKRDVLRNQLTAVKRMPLQDMHIARPVAMLAQPHVGYVMELLTGMVPIKTLMEPPPKEGSVAEWYIQTGGLRRRLRLLAKAAQLLAQIHGKGLVYGDPSPGNIFVSEDVTSHEVWLLDADNLRYQSAPADDPIYTPEYGAPELVQGRSGVNTLTDAYAFAVIAFKTLSLVHPLLGDYVNDGEPELEEQALCGKLPWIDHPEDDLNRASNGIPREMVLSPRLLDLTQRTFQTGLNNPQQRPGLMEWVEKLTAAAETSLPCPECGGSFYFKETLCSWCDHPRASFAILRIVLWDAEKNATVKRDNREQIITPIVLGEGDQQELTDRHLFGKDSDIPRLRVSLNNRLLSLENLGTEKYRVFTDCGEEMLGTQIRTLNLVSDNPYRVHLGSADQLHRVIKFDYQEGA